MGNTESTDNADERLQRSVLPGTSQKRIEESLAVYDRLSEGQVCCPSSPVTWLASSVATVPGEKKANVEEDRGASKSSLAKRLSKIATASASLTTASMAMPESDSEMPVRILREYDKDICACPTPFQSMSGDRIEVVNSADPKRADIDKVLSASFDSETIGEKQAKVEGRSLQHQRRFNAYLDATRRIPPSLIALEDIVKCRMGTTVSGIHTNTPVATERGQEELLQKSSENGPSEHNCGSLEVLPINAGGSGETANEPASSLKAICRVSKLRRQWNYESLQESGFVTATGADETPPLPVLLRREVEGGMYADIKDSKSGFLLSTSSSDMQSPSFHRFPNGTRKRISRRNVHTVQPPSSLDMRDQRLLCSSGSSPFFAHNEPGRFTDASVGTEGNVLPLDTPSIPPQGEPETAGIEILEMVRSIVCILLRCEAEISALNRRMGCPVQVPLGAVKTAPIIDPPISQVPAQDFGAVKKGNSLGKSVSFRLSETLPDRHTISSFHANFPLHALQKSRGGSDGHREPGFAEFRTSPPKTPASANAPLSTSSDPYVLHLDGCTQRHQSANGAPSCDAFNGGLGVSTPRKTRPLRKIIHWAQKNIKKLRVFSKSDSPEL